jgi:putative (di)nucleoside polyphosphate hydrolase
MIDASGFRANIGIVLVNRQDQVFLAKRFRREAWQFPQGGMHEGETPEQTLFRELEEETGLKAHEVRILGRTRHWLKYRIPTRLIRPTSPVCIGQKQIWFLLRLEVPDTQIHFEGMEKPEFDGWQWVHYWYPLRHIVLFKREVYRRALQELAPYLFKNVPRHWSLQPLNYLMDN